MRFTIDEFEAPHPLQIKRYNHEYIRHYKEQLTQYPQKGSDY